MYRRNKLSYSITETKWHILIFFCYQIIKLPLPNYQNYVILLSDWIRTYSDRIYPLFLNLYCPKKKKKVYTWSEHTLVFLPEVGLTFWFFTWYNVWLFWTLWYSFYIKNFDKRQKFTYNPRSLWIPNSLRIYIYTHTHKDFYFYSFTV